VNGPVKAAARRPSGEASHVASTPEATKPSAAAPGAPSAPQPASDAPAHTLLPTLPEMIERSRSLIEERGELVVIYFHFVRYSKIEELYGWEKLDEVLETTAQSVKEYLGRGVLSASKAMVSFTNDDNFVFFHVPAPGVAAASEAQITELVRGLERYVAGRMCTTTRRYASRGWCIVRSVRRRMQHAAWRSAKRVARSTSSGTAFGSAQYTWTTTR
jgi:hypothetical protein